MKIILVLKGLYNPILVYLQLLLACYIPTGLTIFKRKGYPYSLIIFIYTSTRINTQAYLSPFLSLYILLPIYYLLLVELIVLDRFSLDRRYYSLSYTGIGYIVRLAILGLVLDIQLIYTIQGNSLEPNQLLKSLIQLINSFLE